MTIFLLLPCSFTDHSFDGVFDFSCASIQQSVGPTPLVDHTLPRVTPQAYDERTDKHLLCGSSRPTETNTRWAPRVPTSGTRPATPNACVRQDPSSGAGPPAPLLRILPRSLGLGPGRVGTGIETLTCTSLVAKTGNALSPWAVAVTVP